jgi:signal transduction histidine kinase
MGRVRRYRHSMVGSRFRTSGAVDAAIALFFTLALQLEIWIWWVPEDQGPKAFAAPMGLLLTLPLLWRRRLPLASLVASMAVLLVWTLVAAPEGSLWPLLTTLVLVFSVALYASPRHAAAGLGVAAAALAVEVASTTNSFGDYAFVGAFFVGSWLAGRAVRARQQRADELFDRTVRMEVEREEKAREAAMNERGRIARDLHDIISHNVSVMVVQAGAGEQMLQSDPNQTRESLRAIQETGRQARLELRRLLGLMRSGDGPALAPQPGLAELETLCEQLRESGLQVDLDVRVERGLLSPGLDLSAYRIIQEALTNALKHGGPGGAQVYVRHEGDALELEVLNDGRAAPADDETGGFGLIGISERVALYGGTFEHGRSNGGGYRLRARLPLSAGER